MNKIFLVCMISCVSLCGTSIVDSKNNLHHVNKQKCDEVTDNREKKNLKRKYESKSKKYTLYCVKQDQSKSDSVESDNEEDVKSKKKYNPSYIKMKNLLPGLNNFDTMGFVRQNKSNINFIKNAIYPKKLPNMVISDEVSLRKWKEVVNAFITIFSKFFKFYSSEDFEFNKLDIFEHVKTVEDLDYYLEQVIMKLQSIKLNIPLNEYENSLVYTKHIAYVLSQKDFSIRTLMGHLLFYSNLLHLEMDIKSLTVLLLHKINKNRIFLEEIKSIVLTVFYLYPTEEYELNNKEYVKDLGMFISKMILLIDVTNYYKQTEESSKLCVQRIRYLITRNLILYYSKNNTLRRANLLISKKTRVFKLIEDNPSLKMPIDPYNFLFMNFLLAKYMDIVSIFCEPVLNLKSNEKLSKHYNKMGFSYLVKSIERLYRLGDFILESMKIKNI
ncbi:hypothetical protein NGRA_0485 [Nosema granulosis]|uniref:Uncharacterized protein n=1 Tax=Nosema granulosis TaxID=83296 RepID=A0A9P6L0B2_9MICR|nr:hypothetical protein NGRA_0485 [Nosema granulosis]